LDEPTRGLDIFGVRTLRATLKRLRDAGTCILMSNHVMAEVAELSDDVVVLGGGNVLAHGSMQEIQRATGAGDLESAFVTLAGGSTVQGTAA
jgi:ABC-type Na+ transport system ATPase subunit NatA